MTNSENSLSQKSDIKNQVNDAIKTLKFFDYRLRKEMKSRKEQSNSVDVSTSQPQP